jgi:hypothetical protein
MGQWTLMPGSQLAMVGVGMKEMGHWKMKMHHVEVGSAEGGKVEPHVPVQGPLLADQRASPLGWVWWVRTLFPCVCFGWLLRVSRSQGILARQAISLLNE